jgi:hypothetical protein
VKSEPRKSLVRLELIDGRNVLSVLYVEQETRFLCLQKNTAKKLKTTKIAKKRQKWQEKLQKGKSVPVKTFFFCKIVPYAV